jgi:hypothetical protein
MFLDNITLMWLCLGAASFCSFMIGRTVSRREVAAIIESTVDTLIAENMLRTKKVNGQLEILSWNED